MKSARLSQPVIRAASAPQAAEADTWADTVCISERVVMFVFVFVFMCVGDMEIRQ